MVADQMAATAEKAGLIENLRRANAALVESNAELERQYVAVLEARRIKDEFLANISHELRTPLTAVIGYISLMEEGLVGPINAEQQHALGQVKASSEQLLGLIGDLLELTTLKRGGLEATVTEFDPRAPMREAVAAARERKASVTLEVVEPEHALPMRSDRRKITRILGALVDNAFKFTHQGEIRIALRIHGDRAVYSVEDTGIGIPADAQRYVFDEFRQGDGTLTRQYGGSGLGLTLARRLARLLGGEIALQSAAGQGSTFTVDVPLEFDGQVSPRALD
jgi:signal transduction histidine kinase